MTRVSKQGEATSLLTKKIQVFSLVFYRPVDARKTVDVSNKFYVKINVPWWLKDRQKPASWVSPGIAEINPEFRPG